MVLQLSHRMLVKNWERCSDPVNNKGIPRRSLVTLPPYLVRHLVCRGSIVPHLLGNLMQALDRQFVRASVDIDLPRHRVCPAPMAPQAALVLRHPVIAGLGKSGAV